MDVDVDVDVFSVIADPVRRSILVLLAHQPAAAGDVAEAFPHISRPAVSRHLRVLRNAGLVRAESVGRNQIYTATTAPLGEVTDWIDALAPGVASRFDALETEVYRTRRERTTNQPAKTIEERTA